MQVYRPCNSIEFMLIRIYTFVCADAVIDVNKRFTPSVALLAPLVVGCLDTELATSRARFGVQSADCFGLGSEIGVGLELFSN